MKTKSRTKQTGEVFTPLPLCDEILDKLDSLPADPKKTIIDPACGNGQFLVATAYRRKCLKNIFGVDLMVDNVCDTIARLHFLKLGFGDAFDHTGHSNCTTDKGHDEDIHPTFDWLIEQDHFERKYTYNGVSAAITIGGAAGADGIIFKCNGELYPTIVCANSLDFFKDPNSNGYDYLKSKIKFFNDHNSEPVIYPEPIIESIEQPIPKEPEIFIKPIVLPIKEPKPVTKKKSTKPSKLQLKIEALTISVNRLHKKQNKSTSELKELQLIEEQLARCQEEYNNT